MNATLLGFILGLLGFVVGFAGLTALLVRRLEGRLSAATFGWIERSIIAGMFLGLTAMIQPWSPHLFGPGFVLLLICTLAYTAWSHVSPRAAEATGSLAAVALQPQENPLGGGAG